MTDRPVRLALALLALATLVLLGPAGVRADQVVDASTPVIISDDISNTTTDVQSAGEGGGEEEGGG